MAIISQANPITQAQLSPAEKRKLRKLRQKARRHASPTLVIGDGGGGGSTESLSDASSETETSSSSSNDNKVHDSVPPAVTSQQDQDHHHRRRRRPRMHTSKKTKALLDQITKADESQYVAMDTEMVGVGEAGQISAVARVTLTDWHGTLIYDAWIRPDRPVRDFRTFVTGITPADLDHALDLETCRQQVIEILQGKILVGHGLKNDMRALGIQHDWQRVRDTAKYEPFMKVRFSDGILWPRKLRDLAAEHLHRNIQVPGHPHCPVEDAQAAMDLYKSVRTSFEKTMRYKIQRTLQIEKQKLQQK